MTRLPTGAPRRAIGIASSFLPAGAMALLGLVATGVLWGEAGEKEKKAALKFTFKPGKAADVLSAAPDGSLFTIRSKTGIGRATIELLDGDWPSVVSFHFHDEAGNALKGLEQFKLEGETFKIDGSLKDTGKMPFFVRAKDGTFEAKGTVKAMAMAGVKAIEVTLPPDMLKGARKLDLSWVDFFR